MTEVGAPSLQNILGYNEISSAFEIVSRVRKDSLKFHPHVFGDPLYCDTILDRLTPRGGFKGDNEVVMKNVYYMATLSPNICDEVVLLLVDKEVFTVQEGNSILRLPTNKLRGVQMYALLMEKEDPGDNILAAVATVLREHGNDSMVGVLETHFNLDLSVAEVDNGNGGRGQNDGGDQNNVPGPQGDGPNAEKWTCRFCTFLNNSDVHICEVCAKSDDVEPDNSLAVLFCPRCTLMNEADAEECVACGSGLNPDSDDHDDNDCNGVRDS